VRKQVLLNAASFILLVPYVLYLTAFVPDSLCIVNRHCDMTGEGFEKFDLCLGKGIPLVV
jgi:hypothetical protein